MKTQLVLLTLMLASFAYGETQSLLPDIEDDESQTADISPTLIDVIVPWTPEHEFVLLMINASTNAFPFEVNERPVDDDTMKNLLLRLQSINADYQYLILKAPQCSTNAYNTAILTLKILNITNIYCYSESNSIVRLLKE